MSNFNEFELLTLREGLFAIREEIISQEEFDKIDTKIKTMIAGLEC